MFQLKEQIHRSTGLPPHAQRLMIGARDVDRTAQAVAELLPAATEPTGEPPEIGLIVREYDRHEMQAAYHIRAVWNRWRPAAKRQHERDLREHEAATRIAAFMRRRGRG